VARNSLCNRVIAIDHSDKPIRRDPRHGQVRVEHALAAPIAKREGQRFGDLVWCGRAEVGVSGMPRG
jgi:hypothetical protein